MGSESKAPHPFQIRDRLDMELMAKMEEYPEGPWKTGIAAVALMNNSASHWVDSNAVDLLASDVVRAMERGTPAELIRFAVARALEWRRILISEKGRPEWEQMHPISISQIQDQLKGKVDDEAIKKIKG